MLNRTMTNTQPLVIPAVNKVEATAPFRWLAEGWQDFQANPLASGFYGLMFVIAGFGVVSASMHNTLLVMTFVTGFFLVAPFLCLGLYELSRQREVTGSNRLGPSLFVFTRRKRDMALLVVFQALIMIAWIRLVTLMSAIYVTNTGTSVKVLQDQLFISSEGLGFVGMFILAGAGLAALAFITSAVAWPMLLHRASGVLIAIATSVKAVMHNKLTMLIWAVMIGALIVMGGIVTSAIGLVIILPVIGHASWHAYRDLVE